MTKPLVSVVVPIFNAEQFLHECLDSVVSQKYKNLEIILINDGSTDNSGKIADDYAERDSRVKVIHQTNAGQSVAKNMGIIASTGKYITFIDADDWIYDDFIKSLLGDMTRLDVKIVTTGSTNHISRKREGVTELVKTEDALKRMYYGTLEGSKNGTQMYEAQLIIDNGILFDKNVKIGEDFCFLVQAILVTDKIAVNHRNMRYYRDNKDSIMHQAINKDFMKILTIIPEIGLPAVQKYPKLDKAIRAKIFSDSVSLAVRGYYERQNWTNDFEKIWHNIKSLKLPTLMNSDVKLKVRFAAFLYCVFGNNLGTIIIKGIKK